ncbi:AAA family ATPase [Parabacteroides sp.]
MIINNLILKGFKSFKDKEIKLGSLTLLTGINSSGKSSIVQGIRMLNRAKSNQSPLIPGYGDCEELKNQNSQWPMIIGGTTTEGKEVEITFESPSSEAIIKSDIAKDGFELTYISASRFGPQNTLPINTTDLIGELGENMLKSIEIHQDDIIPKIMRHPDSEGDTLYFNLRGWLNAIAPGTKFTHEIVKVADTSYMKFNNFRAANVGFGLSYALPVIASLLVGSLKKSQIVIIENPEAHLHPKGQTEIASLISRAVQAGVQVIIETHSDHLFDGVRLYAKKHPEFAPMVTIHWCELDSNSNTEIESPELKGNGKLSFWPKGLFDQFEINADALI